jgi:hypothetical protein
MNRTTVYTAAGVDNSEIKGCVIMTSEAARYYLHRQKEYNGLRK